MTKTLTEQWCDGTLPEGLYYIEGKGNHDIALIRNRYCPVLTSPYCEDDVFESEFVPVAHVPSYDEYKELLRHSELSRNLVYEVLVNQKEYNELLDKAKENKRLQEQLKIATNALKDCYNDMKYWAVLTRRNQRILNVIKNAIKETEGVK